MLKIDYIKNYPDTIPVLAKIWHDVLGKIWMPDITLEAINARFNLHLNDKILPLTYVAFDGDEPVGMCSLRAEDGTVKNLTPWLASLVVDQKYQGKNIGKMLINKVKSKAKEMGYNKIYLCVFDPNIAICYKKIGWRNIGNDISMGHEITIMETDL
jgi:GNAT superfamily N-acetyltransferase